MTAPAHISPELVVHPLKVYSTTLVRGIGVLMSRVDVGYPDALSEADEQHLRYVIQRPESYAQLVVQPRTTGQESLRVLGTVSLNVIRSVGQAPYAQLENLAIDPTTQLNLPHGSDPAEHPRTIGRQLLHGVDVWCQERSIASARVCRGARPYGMVLAEWATRSTNPGRAADMMYYKEYDQ